MKETLSDKRIRNSFEPLRYGDSMYLKEEDVKDFIRDVLKKCDKCYDWVLIEYIIKRAGKELAGNTNEK